MTVSTTIAKTITKVVMLTLLMSAFSSIGHAEESDLKAAAKVLEDGFGKGRQASEQIELYKKAGITYQPELLTPLKDIADCKDQEKLRVLLGIYAFDLGYARAFDKRKEMTDTRMAMQNDLVDRLEVRDKLDGFLAKADKSRQGKKDNDEIGSEEALKIWNDWVRDMIEKAEKDPQVMVLLMDMMYGATIEGLHVICNIALNAEKGDGLIALFNKRASRMEIMDNALSALNDKDLTARVNKESRLKLVRTVMEMVKTKKGELTREDIQQILTLVEPERGLYIKKCD